MAQTQEFRGVARSIQRFRSGVVQYTYHNTAVVTHNPDGSVILNSGGWKTATTRTAMNQASNQAGLGFRVYQRARDWFVRCDDLDTPFVDGMSLRPTCARSSLTA